MNPSDKMREFLTLRCRALNKNPVRQSGSDYVLCWLQQTLRGRSNPVVDAALLAGRKLRKPVLVYHGLGETYPYASDRLHTFILEASQALEADIEGRGVRFIRYVQRADRPNPGLLYRLAERATSIIVDDVATFVGRSQAARVAANVPIAVLAVDGLRLVPDAALGGHYKTTKAFRARSTALRDTWLAEPSDARAGSLFFDGELDVQHEELASPEAVAEVASLCDIDHSVGPIDFYSGGRSRALKHLEWVQHHVLPLYASKRNNPADLGGVSRLSPYLHFGVLSPREVADTVLQSDTTARDRWKFNDQLLTWREYYYHRATHSADPASYSSVPASGRATLDAHRKDERSTLYALNDLLLGNTKDETWNAAQKQFLTEGWMHNNLRMYWGKRLIGWTASPDVAWATACYLNDRLSLDGRDPATYGGIAWCFTQGRYSETSVYGRVSQKSDRAIRRRPGATEWLAEMAGRQVDAEIAAPDRLPDFYRRVTDGTTPGDSLTTQHLLDI